MKALYSTRVTAFGGRDGRVRSDDGILDLEVRPPSPANGTGTARTNPEQLFAAGYAACFGSAVQHVARQQGHTVQATVTATVGLGQGDGGFDLAVTLAVRVDGVERDVAQQLIDTAHMVCPYSRATRGNVDVVLSLVDAS